LAVGEEKKKIINYPTFSEREEEDIDNFIIELKKAFVINRIPNNKKHMVAASCLKEIIANFYDGLAEIIG